MDQQRTSPVYKKKPKYRVRFRFKVIAIVLVVLIVTGFNYLLSPMAGQEPGEKGTKATAGETTEPAQQVNATPDTKGQAVDKTSEYLLLVNKKNKLSPKYQPKDLVTLKQETNTAVTQYHQLRKKAAKAFYLLAKAAKKKGHTIVATTGYRPYEYQKSLFQTYSNKDGAKAANTYSAKPGYSEHQTGLAADVTSPSVGFTLDRGYGEKKEGKWLAQNAHKFGYIIRYPKGKEDVTGYEYEPWHIRYVGKTAAAKIYKKNGTLEEYLGEE